MSTQEQEDNARSDNPPPVSQITHKISPDTAVSSDSEDDDDAWSQDSLTDDPITGRGDKRNASKKQEPPKHLFRQHTKIEGTGNHKSGQHQAASTWPTFTPSYYPVEPAIPYHHPYTHPYGPTSLRQGPPAMRLGPPSTRMNMQPPPPGFMNQPPAIYPLPPPPQFYPPRTSSYGPLPTVHPNSYPPYPSYPNPNAELQLQSFAGSNAGPPRRTPSFRTIVPPNSNPASSQWQTPRDRAVHNEQQVPRQGGPPHPGRRGNTSRRGGQQIVPVDQDAKHAQKVSEERLIQAQAELEAVKEAAEQRKQQEREEKRARRKTLEDKAKELMVKRERVSEKRTEEERTEKIDRNLAQSGGHHHSSPLRREILHLHDRIEDLSRQFESRADIRPGSDYHDSPPTRFPPIAYPSAPNELIPRTPYHVEHVQPRHPTPRWHHPNEDDGTTTTTDLLQQVIQRIERLEANITSQQDYNDVYYYSPEGDMLVAGKQDSRHDASIPEDDSQAQTQLQSLKQRIANIEARQFDPSHKQDPNLQRFRGEVESVPSTDEIHSNLRVHDHDVRGRNQSGIRRSLHRRHPATTNIDGPEEEEQHELPPIKRALVSPGPGTTSRGGRGGTRTTDRNTGRGDREQTNKLNYPPRPPASIGASSRKMVYFEEVPDEHYTHIRPSASSPTRRGTTMAMNSKATRTGGYGHRNDSDREGEADHGRDERIRLKETPMVYPNIKTGLQGHVPGRSTTATASSASKRPPPAVPDAPPQSV